MSEDMWHVEIEPGDVKVVTLEQMDDMYRLDIIQGTTKVWQEGMPRALPLSVVAGIEESDEPEEEIMEIEPEPLDSAPVLTSRPPPPSSTIKPPPSASAAVSQAPPASPAPNPDIYSPQSLRPITMSGAPDRAPAGTGTGGRIVMVLAVAAGLAITLYRNDLLLAAAQSAGSESAYAKVESAVGQPGFGTTRSVEELAALAAPPDAAAAAIPTTAASPTPSDPKAEPEPKSAALPEKDSAARAKEAQPEPSKGNSAPAPASVKSRRAHRPAKKQLKGFKGSEYDPMNAKL